MSVQGKVIIVTGASRGIGSAVATLMAAHGAKVIVNYSNSEAAANATVKAIEEQGGTAIAVKADVRQPEEVAFLFDEAQKAFGQVDVLVNNAGTMISKLL